MWLLAAGIHDIDFTRGPAFSMRTLALQAAIEGQGVALASSFLVADDLAAGRLVVPFDLSVCDPLDFAYHIVVSKRTATLPKVAAFKNWLLGEIARTCSAAVDHDGPSADHHASRGSSRSNSMRKRVRSAARM
jgi:LysR family glycine cleavage system transcriptional activator